MLLYVAHSYARTHARANRTCTISNLWINGIQGGRKPRASLCKVSNAVSAT